MTSICLDIETLDVEDHAVIIEMGLVAFSRVDFTIIDRRSIPLDLFEQISRGRTISSGTIDFHRQKDSLPTHFSGMLPLDALAAMNSFVNLHRPKHVWVQGPDFDLPKLRSYFHPIGQGLPWDFWRVRDSRTLLDLAFPDVKHAPRPHRAVPDCEATIRDIAKALLHLNCTAAA